MNQLEAINKILPFMGEDPVSSIDESFNPTVGRIKAALDDAVEGLLHRGLWFNRRTQQFLPNSSNRIPVPSGIMDIRSVDGRVLTQRGQNLFDMDNGTDIFTEPVVLTFNDILEWDDIPGICQEQATWEAAIQCYSADTGVDSTVQILQQNLAGVSVAVQREHLRAKRYNTNKLGSAARIRNSLGGLYARR